MDGGLVQAGNVVDQLLLRFVRDRVGLDDVQGAFGGDLGLGAHPVPDPAKPDAVDSLDSGHARHGGGGIVDQVRVNRVHQPSVDVPGDAAQHRQDRDGDQQSDDGVG